MKLCDQQKKQRVFEFQKNQRQKFLLIKNFLITLNLRLEILKKKRGFVFVNEDSLYFLKNEENIPEEKFFDEYANFLENHDFPNMLQILPFLKKLQTKTSLRQFPLEKFIENKQTMIKILVELLLKEEFPIIQFYTCWILSNILASDTIMPFDKIIFENGGLDNFYYLMTKNYNESNNELYCQITWALGNLFASDNIPFEEINLKLVTLCKIILNNINEENEEISVWTLANILKNNIMLQETEFNEILKVLANLLYRSQNESVQLDIFTVVSKYICKNF